MTYARHMQLATIDFLIGNTDPLPKETALMCMVAAMTADGHVAETANLLRYVLQEHSNLEEVREMIIQTHLFCGYPKALNALNALRQAAEKEGVDLSSLRSEPSEEGADEKMLVERGAKLWGQVYGDNASKVTARAKELSPDLEYWSRLEGYGRVLSREGSEPLTRQFAIVAALMLLDVHPQLKGHIQGALNMGATKDQLWALLTTVRKLFEANKLFDAVQKVFESVLGKKQSDLSLEEERKYQW